MASPKSSLKVDDAFCLENLGGNVPLCTVPQCHTFGWILRLFVFFAGEECLFWNWPVFDCLHYSSILWWTTVAALPRSADERAEIAGLSSLALCKLSLGCLHCVPVKTQEIEVVPSAYNLGPSSALFVSADDLDRPFIGVLVV